MHNTRAANRMRACLLPAMLVSASFVAGAFAQPQIISLGSGTPNSVTVDLSGTRYIGGSGFGVVGAARWTLVGNSLVGQTIGGNGGGLISADGVYQTMTIPNSSPQTFGNAAATVTPAFNPNPTLTPTAIATTEFRAARWSSAGPTTNDIGGLPIVSSLAVFGSSSSGGSGGNFMSPNTISPNGRFVGGLGYVSTYNSAGTSISANSFRWRAWIWDSQANGGAGGITILPTPFRTTSDTLRRRTGNCYAISNDGLVVLGAQEHNVASGSGPDPDGGRLVVWRWDSGTSQYVMSYLPNGGPAMGSYYTYSSTPGSVLMNSDGTIIVGRAVDNNGAGFIGKWTWNAGTSSWDGPASIGSNLSTPASWLPNAVTTCGVPPTITPTGMTEDGNTIVGTATYSTCGSFMSGGFIWTAASGLITDWYDYCVAQNVAGITENYGPIGDFGDPNRGLPKLGFPSGIASDGSAIVGFQGGTQIVIGATPWVMLMNGGPGCIAPSMSINPAASTLISACSTSVILNANALGTRPVTYQWYKGATALTNGFTADGSEITGADTFQCRINNPKLSDLGTYHCEITGPCGAVAVSTNAVVSQDPAFPTASNDTCAGAQIVAQGSNVLAPAQSPCSAYTNDPSAGASCVTTGTKADRWYVFTPSTTREYRVETCGANFDTALSIFDNCGGFELACNNDYNTGPSTGCTSTRSRVGRLLMTAGVPYYIRVSAPSAAFLSASSTINLSINPAPAAAVNDSCSNPTIAVLGANAFDLTEATPDGFFSACDTAIIPNRDVWFTYTPQVSGKMRIATCPGTTIDTIVSVLDSLCGNELTCNDNAGITGCTNQSIIDNFVMNAGQTYEIRVAGKTLSAIGAGTMTLTYSCDADLNGDGQINLTDLSTLLSNFGVGSGATRAMGDLSGDGAVDLTDLAQLLAAFGLPCS